MIYTIRDVINNKKRIMLLKRKFKKYSNVFSVIRKEHFFYVLQWFIPITLITSFELSFFDKGEITIPVSLMFAIIILLFRSQTFKENKESVGLSILSKQNKMHISASQSKIEKLIKNTQLTKLEEDSFKFEKYDNFLFNTLENSSIKEVIKYKKDLSTYIENIENIYIQRRLLVLLEEKLTLNKIKENLLDEKIVIKQKQGKIINV
jgi:hypothetical protein